MSRFPSIRTTLVPAFLLLVSAIIAPARAQKSSAPAILKIDAATPLHTISPDLYGLMTEEINHSYDGGLYAELVRNRTFHGSWMPGPTHWAIVQRGNARASMTLDRTHGPSAALPASVRLDVTDADADDPAGMENSGFWGIALRPATLYRGSFYARAASAAIGPVTVSLIDDNTGKVEASATVPSLSTAWAQYRFALKTGRLTPSSTNHLVLSVQHSGTVWFDLVSLFPPTYDNRPNGNRIDIMQKLAAMNPSFLRFPGGNYLEGNTIAQRFDWKKTIGPLVDRPTHMGPWGYRSSDGMGLLEFLEWCQDLHMHLVLAVYAGYSLQGAYVDPGSALAPYVQDALDEIEYVTGSTQTKWGAERAKDGHPAPFPLTYVEVGNEDGKPGTHYNGRFAQFYDAIRKKYPRIQIIATAPVTSRKPDVLDEHFYLPAASFFDDAHHYDRTDRNGPKIFVGEWATREGTPTPNFSAALGDAAWMTGLERDSDIVIMASYAPLLTNINPGAMQWAPDLIGYNAMTSYGSPSYYAQVMFSNHRGTQVVASQVSGAGPRFFYSATSDPGRHVLYLKLVNASSAPQPLEIQLAGMSHVSANAQEISLRANTPEETNSMAHPTRIVPVRTTLSGVGADFHHTLPPLSIQLLVIHQQ